MEVIDLKFKTEKIEQAGIKFTEKIDETRSPKIHHE